MSESVFILGLFIVGGLAPVLIRALFLDDLAEISDWNHHRVAWEGLAWHLRRHLKLVVVGSGLGRVVKGDVLLSHLVNWSHLLSKIDWAETA